MERGREKIYGFHIQGARNPKTFLTFPLLATALKKKHLIQLKNRKNYYASWFWHLPTRAR
jgi:hypothetical protein